MSEDKLGGARLRPVIEVEHTRGAGTAVDPVRTVVSYFGMDGTKLAESDPQAETAEVPCPSCSNGETVVLPCLSCHIGRHHECAGAGARCSCAAVGHSGARAAAQP